MPWRGSPARIEGEFAELVTQQIVEPGARISPAEAARQLGIGRSTIYREMRRMGSNGPGACPAQIVHRMYSLSVVWRASHATSRFINRNQLPLLQLNEEFVMRFMIAAALGMLTGCGLTDGSAITKGSGQPVSVEVVMTKEVFGACHVTVALINIGNERIKDGIIKANAYNAGSQIIADGILSFSNLMPSEKTTEYWSFQDTACEEIKKVADVHSNQDTISPTLIGDGTVS